MDDAEILNRIHSIVDAQHEVRQRAQDDPASRPDAAAQLRGLEEALDQCWDLLRQRRAHKEFDQNPDEAKPRPVSQVESYLQ